MMDDELLIQRIRCGLNDAETHAYELYGKRGSSLESTERELLSAIYAAITVLDDLI